MKAQHTAGPWYAGKSGNHQGLIASEATGANIAVSYDSKDAALIAAAPDMLEALENVINAHAVGDRIDYAEILAVISNAKAVQP